MNSPPSDDELVCAREIFASLLARRTSEAEWQAFFKTHPYALTRALPLRLQPWHLRPMGRPGRTEPDFIFVDDDPRWPTYGAVELKRADQPTIVRVRSADFILSRSAETAVAQLSRYAEDLEFGPDSPVSRRALALGNRAHLFVIIGLSDHDSVRLLDEATQIRAVSRGHVQFLPFDTVYERFARGTPACGLQVLTPLSDFWTSGHVVLIRLPSGASSNLVLRDDIAPFAVEMSNFFEARDLAPDALQAWHRCWGDPIYRWAAKQPRAHWKPKAWTPHEDVAATWWMWTGRESMSRTLAFDREPYGQRDSDWAWRVTLERQDVRLVCETQGLELRVVGLGRDVSEHTEGFTAFIH